MINYDNWEEAIKRKAQEIIAQATTPSMSTQEKLLAMHDYLAKYISYDQSLASTTTYDALINGRGICASYATSVQVIMNEMGIY